VQQQRGLIDKLLSGCILEGCKLRGAANESNGNAAMAVEVVAAAAAGKVYISLRPINRNPCSIE
jgi:hypothetical protein